MYKKCIKRLIDCFISFIALMILVIPILVISIAIKIDSNGPVVFKQVRLGKGRKRFTIYKFRTMVTDADILLEDCAQNHGTISSEARMKVMSLIKSHFKPEFINRLDDIILFNPLGKEEMTRILKLQFDELKYEVYR